MLSAHYAVVFLISLRLCLLGCNGDKIRPFLTYYETVSYNRDQLFKDHQRSKRATNQVQSTVQIEIFGYNRNFELMLRRDRSVFTDDFKVMSDDTSIPIDISFVYSGILKDYSLMKDVKSFELSLKKYEFLERMKWNSKEESVTRTKRSVDMSRTTCLMQLKADYLFFKRFRNLQEAISQIAGYMRSVNAIYDQVNFNGIKHINFKVKVLNIIQEKQPDNAMNSAYIGPEKLLMLHSSYNYNNVCLSYLLTNRDYNGVLGVAWTGKEGNNGGICSMFSKLKDAPGTEGSLNTGIVTIQKYGQYLPPRLIHITLAHEIGHSLGSPVR
ncbi:hypothetical protein GDO81_001161 [Engystomops pustulosus]|uniref:Peptidase M12B domain-containing protein n=1 Tax=Engystomops pustulosus TaxID=76066 RepID=A0AAV7DA79_ENGPU|nr:hypothetical protein GDO81_001161 [Engystomops pustulosus]